MTVRAYKGTLLIAASFALLAAAIFLALVFTARDNNALLFFGSLGCLAGAIFTMALSLREGP